MFRYFLEVRYKGTYYSGFQIQQNADSIQGELERAFQVLFRSDITLTGSSRTDSGVHAKQNFFHFDIGKEIKPSIVYNLNALLPQDIAVISLVPVHEMAHCRFDAISRSYQYSIYTTKDPFEFDYGYYFPYSIDFNKLQNAAVQFIGQHDFSTFSKRNTQVKNYICTIQDSRWENRGNKLVYYVKANRFLRGMVRGLVGTMLLIGRSKLPLEELETIFSSGDPGRADFSVPGKGLILDSVEFPKGLFR